MKILLSIMLVFLLTGCATANYSVGKPFNIDNVAKIEHGKTTKQDLVAMFGEPFSKTPLTANQEKWIYTHAHGSSKAQSYIVTMKVDIQGNQQTLDLLIENGVVVNHTFVDGPVQQINVN